jgi:hypothetical protein
LWRTSPTAVYNLEVEDCHTYFVGCEEWGFSVWVDNIRCRHHTDHEGLDGIKKTNEIKAARGTPHGVDVEVEPFGPVNPYSRRSPRTETGAAGGGAYVEFDLPANAVPQPWVGPRNNARIPTAGAPLSLNGLNPKFEKIRWWQFWKWWNK